MNVVYLGFNDPRLHARGVEYVILAQSKAVRRGYYVFLGPRNEIFRWRGLVCISVRKNIVWPLALNAMLRQLRQRHPAMLVHSHNYLMAAVMLRRPDLFTVHDGLAYLKAGVGDHSPVFAWIEAWVYRRSRSIHFISEFAQTQAHRAHERTRHFVQLNTCTREILPETTGAADKVAVWPRPYALLVRSIEKRAALDLVFDVAAQRQIAGEALDFVIAGKGPLLAHYRALVAERGLRQVHLLGYVDDATLARLYAQAELVITPALYGEGFGLPVVEALYYGKRALASAVCALPEIVMSPEDLFDNTAQSLGLRLRQVLDEAAMPDRNPLAEVQARREYYQQRFGAARYVEAFATIYQEVLDETR